MSLISGSLIRRTCGASAVPVMATPTTMSRLGRTARMSSRGSDTGPVKVISPRVMSSFWP